MPVPVAEQVLGIFKDTEKADRAAAKFGAFGTV